MRVSILSFSGRSGGNCGRIAQEIRRFWRDRGEAEVYDFSTFTVTPCGGCGYVCFQERECCPYMDDPVAGLFQAVTDSGLAYYVVPNYCDYPCANYFIFNERSQCYFQGRPRLLEQYLAVRKKFIVVSNTGRDNFTAAFRYQLEENVEPEVLFLSAKQFHKVSIRGDIMDSAKAREALQSFIHQEEKYDRQDHS